MKLKMHYTGLSEATKAVLDLPGKFQRAKRSAMGSVGWLVMLHLRNHLEYGPPEWEGLHALTNKYKKTTRSIGNGNWIMRQKPPRSPATWLGKFARYRVSKSGDTAQIDFGKGKRGKQPGLLDPQLSAVARRIDGGEKIPVTKAMRKKFAATWFRAKARGQEPVIGENFFPLRKSTKSIDIPARPIFAPVFRKIRPMVGPVFEQKFWDSYNGVRRTGQ